ncbi:TonB family protein [Thermodesulfobacteriota bacterium]
MTRLFPFVIASILIHAAGWVCCEHLGLGTPEIPGIDQEGPERIFVTIVSAEERTASAEIPASTEASDEEKAPDPEKRPEETADKGRLLETDPIEYPSENEEPQSEDTPPKPDILTCPPDDEPNDMVEPERDPAPKPKDPLAENPNPKEQKEDEEKNRPSIAQAPSEESRFRSAYGADMANFRAKVLAAIKEASYFPREAASRRQHGRTVVAFSILRDGSLTRLRIVVRSGSKYLDKAALAIVKKASRDFPPLPKRYSKPSIDYILPIVYNKERSG